MKVPRPLVEQTPSIDVRELDRQAWLEPGARFKFFGTKPRLTDGWCIEVDVGSDGRSVSMRVVEEGDQSAVSWRFELVRQTCNLGGARRWFHCAQCARRVAVLYVVSVTVACRRCHGLRYESQRSSARHRPLDRAQRRRMALNGSANMSEPFPEKPRYMRWSAYFELRTRDHCDHTAWLRSVIST